MKSFFKKVNTFKKFSGLLYIIFYFSYVGVNMYKNKGNYTINVILLILTCIYLLFYIYSAFIEENKKIKRRSRKIFVMSKKTLAFVNACMIIASIFSNESNSFFTIFLAIITIIWYLLYLIIDIVSSLALSEIKKYKKELGWKYDYRN